MCYTEVWDEKKEKWKKNAKKKLGSKYNLLNTPANYRSKKDPMKPLGRIDFTKYALSSIIYLKQSSENYQPLFTWCIHSKMAKLKTL